MVDQEKIHRCIRLSAEKTPLEAVKECDLNQKETDIYNDLMIDWVRLQDRKRWHEDEEPERPSLLSMIEEFTERQARMEENFNKMLDYLEGLEERFQHICKAMDGIVDTLHPEVQRGTADWKVGLVQGLRETDAKAKVVNLANRRPPTRTPPEPRKGA